jgi:hypothetical protein
MATTIDISDAPTLLAVEPHRRFICIVALCAVWKGLDVVCFEWRSGEWAILSQRDGSWEEFLAPVHQESAVGRTLHDLTLRSGVLGWLGFTNPSRGFSLCLGEGNAIDCQVARNVADYLLSVHPQGVMENQAEELLKSYLVMRGHDIADAGA